MEKICEFLEKENYLGHYDWAVDRFQKMMIWKQSLKEETWEEFYARTCQERLEDTKRIYRNASEETIEKAIQNEMKDVKTPYRVKQIEQAYREYVKRATIGKFVRKFQPVDTREISYFCNVNVKDIQGWWSRNRAKIAFADTINYHFPFNDLQIRDYPVNETFRIFAENGIKLKDIQTMSTRALSDALNIRILEDYTIESVIDYADTKYRVVNDRRVLCQTWDELMERIHERQPKSLDIRYDAYWQKREMGKRYDNYVYVYFCGDKPLYVGQTNNPLRRYLEHMRENDEYKKIDKIRLYGLVSNKQKNFLEEYLIVKYCSYGAKLLNKSMVIENPERAEEKIYKGIHINESELHYCDLLPSELAKRDYEMLTDQEKIRLMPRQEDAR